MKRKHRCLAILRFTATLAVIWQLFGCTANYTRQALANTSTTLGFSNSHTLLRSADWRLPADTILFLARPQFGLEITPNNNALPRNRTLLHQALEHELSLFFPHTEVAWNDLSLAEAIAISRQQGSQILVFPRLLGYHDHLNTWHELNEGQGIHPDKSYGRDQAMVEIVLVEAFSGKILDTTAIVSKQHLFASAENATTLYTQAARRFVARLSGRQSLTERPR